MSFLLGQAAKSDTTKTILKIVIGAGILYAAYQFIKPRIDGIIPTLPSLPSLPTLPSLPSLPEVNLPELPSLPDLPSLPTLPSLPSLPTLPNLPTLPTLPDFTEVGKMEIPINIPSADDVMNFFKSPTGQQVAEAIIPEVLPEVQGALVGADVPLLMEVIRSQNPRETRLPTGEVVPPAPPVPNIPSISAELDRRSRNTRGRRFA